MAETDPHRGSSRNFGVLTFFVVGGLLVGSSAYVALIPPSIRLIMKLSLPAVFLVIWWVSNRRENAKLYEQISFSYLAISLGFLLAHYVGNAPLRILNLSVNTIQGIAVAKVGEVVPIVLPILVLHFATGGSMDDLYLGAGNIRLSLIVGGIGFAAFAGFGMLQAMGSGLTTSTVIANLPWIAAFIFANAFMEELWFRALFLKKLSPQVGVKTAMVVTSVVFAAVHISSTYVTDILVFMAALLALGLIWSWLMQRSNSIWGSVLFHAGGDVLVMIGFLAQIAAR